MRKLFPSFTAALAALAAGSLTDEDLADGLFFFGCVRGHALEPGTAGESDERTWFKGGFSAFVALKTALLAAETDGRVAWFRPELAVRLDAEEVLNGLLSKFGYPSLVFPEGYGYPALKAAVLRAGLPLEVVA